MSIILWDEYMKNVLEFLEKTAEKAADKTAVVYQKDSICWAKLLENSKKAGTSLAKVTNKNMPIPVLMEKSIETDRKSVV